MQQLPTIDMCDCSRGAPMGRSNWYERSINNLPDRSIRVFHVPIDSQGYDPGGAYWGIGTRLYCATDCADYRRFVRAYDRDEAIRLLEIPLAKLLVQSNLPARG